ncbi:sensor histidine kinase [Streptomyces sp. A1499]|uniref:GAF domain-containing sensor histidine kinase n=1 Tax=Streptomyces sp. A1499 TaxID=2563104 RepID=UPI001F118C86|nr:sensor histidine kinase [Streptomyces sp. A1499]
MARAAGMALGLLAAVLVVKLTVLSVSGEQWRAVHYSQPQTIAEVMRLAVGLPVWVIGALLLADRSGRGMGALLLAAGAVLVVPRTVSDLLAVIGDWSAPVDVTVLALAAVALAGHPLSVLVFPVCFLREPAVRRCRWYVIAPAAAAHAGHGALWFLGVPGAPPFFSPWSGTATAQWALRHIGPVSHLVDWVSGAAALAVTAAVAHCSLSGDDAAERRRWLLLAVAYAVCVSLLLGQWWPERWTMAARAGGGTVWVVVICLTVARSDVWRLQRATVHRLSVAFVLTVFGTAAVGAALVAWAALPAVRSTTSLTVAGCALLAGWVTRPVVVQSSLRVERFFYGSRARPHHAMRKLVTRLQEAPDPRDVPEQICRSAVEDLGVSGAAVEVDTRSGVRRLGAVGVPVIEPKQVFALRHHGQVVGRLEVARDGTSTPVERDSDLLSLLADQAGPALAALRLVEEAQAARESLVLAREEERRRLRREIHDGLGPQLAAVQMRLGTAQACVGPQSSAPQHLRAAAEGLSEALTEVRRITAGLTPAVLVERGLLEAIRILAHRLSTEVVQVVVADPATTMPVLAPAVETAAYRIAAEAMTNAVRHSGARRVLVSLAVTPASLTVKVSDDGNGLPGGGVPGTGLASFTERAEEIGGTTGVHTGPHGTAVHATLPLTRQGRELEEGHERPERHGPAGSCGTGTGTASTASG